jgi:two-component system nitrogen regulation response regulator GlnG
MAAPTLLVIDDDPLILECFRYAFPRDQLQVVPARTAAEGMRLFLEARPAVVLVDVRLPDRSGLDLFRQMHEHDARVPVIVATGFGTAETAIEAMRLGAYDYVVKPLDPDRLSELVSRALEISRLMRVPAVLPEAGEEETSADVLIGQCPAMQDVYKTIGRVAPQDVTVLVLGESGTGKEMVARAIYHYSRRSAGPFLALNCAAIPESLLESELFGHEKGSFTGAERRRIGKFEQCNGGTLFLDEIGDMTPLTQTKVLRVLQEQRFERVGGTETVQTNVRVIAATNRDLERLMAEGKFRSDLYYRLNVCTVRLPPLRERAADVPLLAEHFVRQFSREMGKSVQGLTAETVEVLRRYSWPGNVRELQGAIRQALLQATGPVLVPDFLPEAVRGERKVAQGAAGLPELDRLIRERLQAGGGDLHAEVLGLVERLLLRLVLEHTKGNQSQASRILGIARPTLRQRLVAMRLIDSEPAPEEGG